MQTRGLDLLVYVRALGLLVRNVSIVVVPLLMAIVGIFIAEFGAPSDGVLGSLTGGIAQLIVLLLKMFGFGTACIIADAAWRRGRASFDESWIEARRKGGEILYAALGFTFILFAAIYAGGLVGPLAPALLAVAVYFLIYTIPAASIGGVPGGAAIQVSVERARANVLPTIIVTIVAVLVFLGLGPLIERPLGEIIPAQAFIAFPLLGSLIDALIQAVGVAYIALVVTKTYTDLSFGRRY